MKKSLFIVALLMLVFTGCKKDTVDVSDLLSTVPSSASGVIVIDVERLVDDTGSKIKDHRIEPSKGLKSCLDKIDADDRQYLQMLLDGESGINPNAAIVFYDANRIYLTYSLCDVDKYISYVEKKNGTQFTDEGSGVRMCGKTAVKGTQSWICVSSDKRLDPDLIASYSSLKSSQSFLVTPVGERLLVEENDIRGWVMFDAYMDSMLDRGQKAMFTMGLGFLFENAESLAFKVDFKSGVLEGRGEMLNDKYKAAKFQLPLSKIDVSTLKGLGETCDGMMAFTISSDLVDKFDKVGTGMGGVLFGGLAQTLRNVDGTVGVIMGGENKSMSGIVTMDGEMSSELKDYISQHLGSISMDGKYVKFAQGTVSGKLNVAECAEALKGSSIGMVIDGSSLKSMQNGLVAPEGLKFLVVKLVPESGTLGLQFDLKTTEPKENALMTLLRLGAS